ncbi:MAG: hypothetical protein FD120_2535, partial [Gammaproteobacteria bacterium]
MATGDGNRGGSEPEVSPHTRVTIQQDTG